MEDQQKRQRIQDMIRQYEYEKFDADLRIGTYKAMGRTDGMEYLEKQSTEAGNALTHLAEELAKYEEEVSTSAESVE